MGPKYLWLRSKIKTNLKFRVKNGIWVKYFCDGELGRMNSVNENFTKSSFENFQKKLPLREFHVKYFKKENMLCTAIAVT